MDNKTELLKALPKVDECIELLKDVIDQNVPARIIKAVVQSSIEAERKKILNEIPHYKALSAADWQRVFKKNIDQKLSPHFKRVVNGTGVVIHTNLGRSILSKKTTDSLAQAGGYYSNLELILKPENGEVGIVWLKILYVN